MDVSFRDYLQEREGRLELLNGLKQAILDKPHKNGKLLKKYGVETSDEVLWMLVSQGNMAYRSGDLEAFEYFVELLFEIIKASPEDIEEEQVLREITRYGLMSAHHHNYHPFRAVLENYGEYLGGKSDVESYRHHLSIMRDLGLKSLNENFEAGVFKVVGVLRDLNGSLKEKELEVCRTYLKNAIIAIASLVEKNQREDMKGRILSDVQEILGFGGMEPQASVVDTTPPDSDEPVEEITQDVQE
jgi:hypothetical protein